MENNDTLFVESIPEQYDTHLGPLLFEFSGRDLAKRLADRLPANGKVLEIACGTGISTEFLRQALPDSVSIVATDLSEAMLSVARRKRGKLANVTYAVADVTDLSFADNTFDAAACQFGIMFFPDKLRGLCEIHRVMKPGAALVFNVWDSVEHNQIIATVQKAIEGFFKEPSSFLEIPFGFFDVAHIEGLMKRAGFEEVQPFVVSATVERPDALSIARGFIEGSPLMLEIRERPQADSEAVAKTVAEAIESAYGVHPKISLREIVFTAVKAAARSSGY